MARQRRVDRNLLSLRQRKYRLQGLGRGGAKAGRFIPDADSDFAHMARQFAIHVRQHAERLSIPQEKAEALDARVRAFRDALSRTMLRVSSKRSAAITKGRSKRSGSLSISTTPRPPSAVRSYPMK